MVTGSGVGVDECAVGTSSVAADGRTQITPAGLQDLAASDYHADQIRVDGPTLSKSILQTLIDQSPAHAYAAHPRLNAAHKRVEEQKFDVGTCAHDLLLEGLDRMSVLDFDDWRTKASKEARDAARANNLIPLLAKQADEVTRMVDAIRGQLVAHEADPPLFLSGTPERTIVWQDDEFGVWCRARLDWLRDDHLAIDDLKTTSRSANPEGWTRSTLFAIGADLQACFYLRGFEQLFGVRPRFRFVVVETTAPFALSVIELGPDVMTLAEKKVRYGLDLWARCLDRDDWPAYPAKVAFADLPPWEESRWLQREMREVAA